MFNSRGLVIMRQIAAILAIPITERAPLVKPLRYIKLNPEQRKRLTYILDIERIIHTTFINTENIKKFMTLINHNEPFRGRTPIEHLVDDDLKQFEETHRGLMSLAIPN